MDTCPHAANHCALFESENELKFNNLEARARKYNHASFNLKEGLNIGLRMRKITFRTYQNNNCFIFSVDHNDIIDHKDCIDPVNLLII